MWWDNTSEFLTAKLRAGNAGSNTATDHVEVLVEAIAQIPASHRKKLLIRADGAGASHQLLDWLTEQIRVAIDLVPKKIWTPAIEADGGIGQGGDVVELTGLIDTSVLDKWPAGMRVIVRRERPHPGAQLSLFEEADGWRYQAFVTNTKIGQLAFLEARHRARARVETSKPSLTRSTTGPARSLAGRPPAEVFEEQLRLLEQPGVASTS